MSPIPPAIVAGLVWKPLALALLAALFSLALRSRAMRHAIWFCVLIGMMTLPVLSLITPPLHLFSRPAPIVASRPDFVRPGAIAALGGLRRGPTGSYSTPSSAPPAGVRVSTSTILGAAYLAVALALLARLAFAYRRARQLAASALPVALHDAEPIVVALSLPWPLPKIRESDEVSTPSVIGHARPIVLLPAGWRDWPPEKLRAILAHELAHVRRSDWAITLASEINRCLFWLHPLAWWLPRHLSSLAEQACDELAVSITGDAATYAEVLLDVASRQPATYASGIAMARSSNVGRRIERILDHRSFAAVPLGLLKWVAVFACAVPLLVATASLSLLAQSQAITIPDPLYESPAPTPAQIADLERGLITNPENQAARLKLATYYLLNVMREERVRHVFWFIENHPESPLHRHNALHLSPYPTPSDSVGDYERGRLLWKRQIESHPNDAAVLLNAGRFFERSDAVAAEDLLNRVRRSEPSNPDALRLLVSLYSHAISSDLDPTGMVTGPFRPDPAVVKHSQEFVESTTEAVFPGRIGIEFMQPLHPGPAGFTIPESIVEHRRRLNEYGAQLLQRARNLEPDNPEWRSAPLRIPPPSPQPSAASEQVPIVTSTVTPVYPPLALQARIQGIVRMKGVVGLDGLLTNLTLVSGHPLLVSRALDAAKRSSHPDRTGQTIIVELPFRLP